MLGKYRNKKILILGGGTSTLDVRWENISYDYLWTCNEFYLEPRVYSKDLDLYALSYTVDLQNNILVNKLSNSDTTILLEPLHYREKIHSKEFKEFKQKIGRNITEKNLELVKTPAGFSGVCFRLILLALESEASKIYFSGFDGFNREFTNIHAFTKHPGLKDSDRRRTYEGVDTSYVNIFTDAYNYFLTKKDYSRLQNLGEGFDYNIGTPVSKAHFSLTEEVYEKIR